MGLCRYAPRPSGRMGLLWTLGGIEGSVILEFGSMGHMVYAQRWMEQAAPHREVKLYTTHLDEKDIALGITKRFFHAIEEIIKKDNPKVIFLLPSTVPSITGMDIETLSYEAEDTYGIRIISLKKGSFHEKLEDGIEEGLLVLAQTFAKKNPDKEKKAVTYNLIGSCVDLEKYHADAAEIKRILKEAFGMEANCVLPSEAEVDSLDKLGEADINLVIRGEGIKAAKALYKAAGMDYVYGRPYGYQGTIQWLKSIGEKLSLPINEEFIKSECEEGQFTLRYLKRMIANFGPKSDISLGGNYDAVKGILEFATGEVGLKALHIWCDTKKYADEKVLYRSEEQLIMLLNNHFHGILMADRTAFLMAKRKAGSFINRSIGSKMFYLYEAPYVGFRGAMNLAALWIEEIMG